MIGDEFRAKENRPKYIIIPVGPVAKGIETMKGIIGYYDYELKMMGLVTGRMTDSCRFKSGGAQCAER